MSRLMTAATPPTPTGPPRPLAEQLLLPGAVALLLVATGAWLVGRGHPAGWLFLLAGAAAGWLGMSRVREGVAERERELAQARGLAAVRDRELTKIRLVADAMLSQDTLDRVLQVIADAVAELLESESAAIGFVVEEGRFVRIVAASGSFREALDQ